MANSDKNILITPNIGQAAQPSIVFTGQGNGPISLRVLDETVGAISFEGSAGQLFGITDNLTSGSIFSVNDVSGIPIIDVQANGTLTLGTTGTNIGIGTTSPVSPFEVQQNTTSTVDFTLTNSNTGANITKGSRIRFRITDSAGTRKDVAYITALPYNSDSSTGDHLSFWTRTADATPTEKVRITNTGNVGIGITNPTDTLQVSGTIFSSSDMSLGGELNFHTPTTKFVDFYTKDAALITYAANMRLVNHDSTSFHSAVRMLRDGAVELYHNNVKRLETTAGGVFVGNAVLGANVGDTLTVADFFHGNGNASYVKIRARRNTTTQDWTGASTKILHITDATEQGYIEFNPNAAQAGMAFGQSTTEFARFLSDGKFGIGITPTEKLHVSGNSIITGNLTVSGGTITAGNVATALLGGNTTTNISLGAGLTTGTLTLGSGTGSGTIAIGNTGTAAAQAVNIATATTGTITIGGTGSTAVQLPTGKTKVGQTFLLQGGAVNITLPSSAGTLYASGNTDVALLDGGTGSSLTGTPGSVVYVSTSTAMSQTAVGTAGQTLISTGAGAPKFVQSNTIEAVRLSAGAHENIWYGPLGFSSVYSNALARFVIPYNSSTVTATTLSAPRTSFTTGTGVALTAGSYTFDYNVGNGDLVNEFNFRSGDYITVTGTGISTASTTVTGGSAGTNTINVTSATNIVVGQYVKGTGIGIDCFVTNVAGTTITLSVNNTATVSGTITFNTIIGDVTRTSVGGNFSASMSAPTASTQASVILTFTQSSWSLSIDGTTPTAGAEGTGDRVLLTSQGSTSSFATAPRDSIRNGIYYVSTGGTSWVLTRTYDANTSALCRRAHTVHVTEGTNGSVFTYNFPGLSSLQTLGDTTAYISYVKSLDSINSFGVGNFNQSLVDRGYSFSGSSTSSIVTDLFPVISNATLFGAEIRSSSYSSSYSNVNGGVNIWTENIDGIHEYVLSFRSGANLAAQLAVNYFGMKNAVTTVGPTIEALGSDTNIDVNVTPKGTGVVRAGTLSLGNAAITAAGALAINTTTSSALTLDSGSTGAVNIGTNANAKTITIGNGTGATSLVLDCGTGALNIGTNAVARTVTVGNTTTTSILNLRSGTGGVAISTGTTGAISIDTGSTGAINIGIGANAKTITIGSTSSTAVQLPTGVTKVGQTSLTQGGAVNITLPALAGTLYASGNTDVALADGGTNASLTAVNGGVVYSSASALAISAAGTSGQLLVSKGAAAPAFESFNLFSHAPDSSYKSVCQVATTADLGASTFASNVLTGYDDTFTLACTTTAGSAIVTTTSTIGIKVGAVVSGNANIPASRTVASIDSATQFTLNSGTSVLAATSITTTFTQTITALSIDGVTLALNDRVLVKDQLTLGGLNVLDAAKYNGIYTVTATGSGTVPWTLTRATDADSATDLDGAIVNISVGTANYGKSYKTRFKGTDTINTTEMYWGRVTDVNSSSYTAAPANATAIDLSTDTETIRLKTGNITDLVTGLSIGVKTINSFAASTYARASSVYIAGAPVQGPSNATITTAEALTVASGASSFNGIVKIEEVPSATTGQLFIVGRSGAVQREGKLRFGATFHTSADTTARLTASIRSGFSASAWGNEYLDFFLNNTNNDSYSDANQGLVMRMAYGGNVGIGTTNPATKLDVNGAAKIGSTLTSRSGSGLTIGFTNNTIFALNTDADDSVRLLSIVNESTTTNAMSVLGFRVNPGTPTANAQMDMKFVGRGATNQSALHYSFNDSDSWKDRFTILSGGQVGIGTTTPSTAYLMNLHGISTSSDSGIYLNLDGWVNNASEHGINIDIDSTATDTLTANRVQYGILNQTNTYVPSNATTTDTRRYSLQGAYNNITVDDNPDINYVAGKVYDLYGSNNRARFDATGGASNIRGAYNVVQAGTHAQILATTAASGTGTVVTLTFAATTSPVFPVGSTILVETIVPTAYRGTFTVTACTTTTVSYNHTATGAQTTAGTVELLSIVDSAYGTYSYVINSSANHRFTNAYGSYNHINPDVAGGEILNAFGSYSRLDHDAGTGETGYLFYGTYEGTWTTKYGLHINGETTNYLSGNVGIGTTNPGTKLDVTGSIRASSQLISTVATGTAPLAVSSTTLVSNLNADLLDGKHLTDVSRLVVTTAGGGTAAADGANTWCKIATFATGTSQFSDCTLLLGVTNTLSPLHDSAIISVFFRSNATNAVPTVDVEILSKGGTLSGHIVNDSFKVISGVWSTNMELWMKKTQQFGQFAIHELSARSQSGTLTYHDGAAWQAATPTGATNNVSSDGITQGLKIQAISAASAAGWVLGGNTIGIANESGVYQDASNNMQFAARDGSGTLRMVLDSNNTSGSYINTTAGFSIGKNTTTPGYTDLGTNLRVGITTQAATYSNAAGGTTITVTATNHGMTSGDSVWIDFTAGTLSALDAYFNTVTVTNSNTFTVTYPSAIAAANTAQACTLYTESQLRFPGAFGDGTNSYDHSIISERLWGGADKSELLIFKGNDSGITIQDNIRLAAAGDIHFHTGFGSVQAATYTNYIAAHGNTTASSTLSILASGGVCVNTGAGFSVGKTTVTPGYTDLGTNLRIGGGAKAGTYTNTAASTTITVTCANHGIGVFNSVYIDFTGGTVIDAYFGVVQSTTQNTFTVTYPSAIPAANTNISCVVYTENQIRFPGQANDTGGNFDTTMIAERSWGAFDKSELLIFKGGESGTSATQDNIRLAASGDIYFHTGFAGAGTTLYNGYTQSFGDTINSSTVSILSSGNVGIGTTNPTTNLHAWGSVTSGGTDFVLGNSDQVTRGNSGSSRALVKDSSATLVVNFNGDFGGGTRIDGPLLIAPAAITRNVTNSNLTLNGGTNATVGANIELYGSTHASQPNNAFYDGTTHTIRSVDGVTTFATINSSGLSPNALLIPYTEGAGTALTATAETTNQVLFPAAGDTISLGLGVYEINMILRVIRGSGSTTSSALRVNLLGTGGAGGTFTGIATSSIIGDGGATSTFYFTGVNVNTNNTVTTTSTMASGVYIVQISGILKVTTAGTIIPAYGLTVNLAGAGMLTTPSATNYMRLLKISTSGTTTAQGGWG